MVRDLRRSTEEVPYLCAFDGEGLHASALRCSGSSGSDKESTFSHDLLCYAIGTVFGLDPDVETETYDIDVRARTPGSAGMFSVRIAESDVDTGKFFILQNIADHTLDAKVGADGKLAHAVGVLVGVSVGPEVGLKLLVGAGTRPDAIGCNFNGERSRAARSP